MTHLFEDITATIFLYSVDKYHFLDRMQLGGLSRHVIAARDRPDYKWGPVLKHCSLCAFNVGYYDPGKGRRRLWLQKRPSCLQPVYLMICFDQ